MKIKNLNELGVQEMDAKEMKNMGGGAWLEAGVLVVVGILVSEWESTKQAVEDAWNGVYNPPK